MRDSSTGKRGGNRPPSAINIKLVASLIGGGLFILFNVSILSLMAPNKCNGENPQRATTATTATTDIITGLENELNELRSLLGCPPSDTAACLETAALIQAKRQADQRVAQGLRQTMPARTKATAAAATQQDFLSAETHHAALDTILPEYQPNPAWLHAQVDLNIIGMLKAGTSQLYHVLAQHPQVRRLNGRIKEYCANLPITTKQNKPAVIQKRLHKWHSDLYQLQKSQSALEQQQLTVNGCLTENEQLSWHLQYLGHAKHEHGNVTTATNGTVAVADTKASTIHSQSPLPPLRSPKYIMILRDPADWLWAVWNFWVDDSGLDKEAKKKWDWTNQRKHYRSPELFHELVSSASKTSAGARMVWFSQLTVTNGRRVSALAGRANVMFLRNEDMLPAVVDRPGGFLDQLSNFTALSRSDFGDEGVKTIRNCNDNKGDSKKCGNTTSSAYEIAGGRPMLESTRDLVYLIFLPACRIWAAEFGVEYPECLNVEDRISSAKVD